MQQITGSQPLCYMLPNSHLVTSLPFIDQEDNQSIPKTMVNYLIRAEQQSMQQDPLSYISELPLPSTPYLDSPQFQQEVDRIKGALSQAKPEQTTAKERTILPQVPKKLVSTEYATVRKAIETGLIAVQKSFYKNINCEILKKLGPISLKELISGLQKQHEHLQKQIEQTKEEINSLNQNRKYEQMEAQERERTMRDRIRVMIHKKRKVQ